MGYYEVENPRTHIDPIKSISFLVWHLNDPGAFSHSSAYYEPAVAEMNIFIDKFKRTNLIETEDEFLYRIAKERGGAKLTYAQKHIAEREAYRVILKIEGAEDCATYKNTKGEADALLESMTLEISDDYPYWDWDEGSRTLCH